MSSVDQVHGQSQGPLPGQTSGAGGLSSPGRLPPAPIRFRRAADQDRAAIEAFQQAAYSREHLLGLEPPPLRADYGEIFARMEVWIAEERDRLRGVLIVEVRSGDLYIWSMAAAPDAQGQGLGQILLDAAEVRARQHNRSTVRLTTGAVQKALVAWYGRHGYTVEATETLDGHAVIHMQKHIATTPG